MYSNPGIRRSATLGALTMIIAAICLQSADHDAKNDRIAARLIQYQPAKAEAFDLGAANIPVREIRSGGPPKDGIPALSNPRLVDVDSVDYLSGSDRIIGVIMGDDVRAYPLSILNYHEIVNDRIGDVPYAVTYCPLCDSAAVFDRRTLLGERQFAVSGLLYNSNVLMYDRGGKPESLWSQVKAEGVSGPAAGKQLKSLPMVLTTWDRWRIRHPNTKVLSDQTGFQRDYRRNPYAKYFATPKLMFPVEPLDTRLPPKTPVLGVWSDDGLFRAYPVTAGKAGQSTIHDAIGKHHIEIRFESGSNTIRVVKADEALSWMHSFWFAWYAMHPVTELYEAAERRGGDAE